MTKVEILGFGCASCKKLAEHAETAARELGIAYEIEKITDVARIVKSGVKATPALIVNGEVLFAGGVAKAAEIRKKLVQEVSGPESGRPQGRSLPSIEARGGVEQNAKPVVRAVLLVFVLASLATLAVREFGGGDSRLAVVTASGPGLAEHAAQSDPRADKTTVYYFHGDARCPTCRKIEAYAQDAVRKDFPRELETGALEWRVLNVQRPDNTHYIRDFQLFTSTLIVVKVRNGEIATWKALDQTWEFVSDRTQFTKYVQDEVRQYLRSQS